MDSIKSKNKIMNHFNEGNSFAIDYSEYGKERFSLYTGLSKEFDKTFLFGKSSEFEDKKKQYGKLKNITKEIELKGKLIRQFCYDFSVDSTTIQNENIKNFMNIISSVNLYKGELLQDRSSINMLFSGRPIKDFKLKDFLFSLRLEKTSYNSLVIKLLKYIKTRFNYIPGSGSYNGTTIFFSEQAYLKIFFNFIFETFAESDFFKIEKYGKKKHNKVGLEKKYKEVFGKNIPTIFTKEALQLFIEEGYQRFNLETFENSKKNNVGELFFSIFNKKLTSKKELKKYLICLDIFKQLQYSIFFYININKLQVNSFNNIDTFEGEETYGNVIFGHDSFSPEEINIYYKLFSEFIIFLVRDFLKIQKNDEILQFMFTKEFLDKEFDTINKVEFDLEKFDIKKHIENILSSFGKGYKNEKFRFNNLLIDENLILSTKYEIVLNLYNFLFKDVQSGTTRLNFLGKIYEKKKEEDEFSEVLTTFSSEPGYSFILYYNQQQIEYFLKKYFQNKDIDSDYKFVTIDGLFETFYDLFGQLMYEVDKKMYSNKNHSIYFVDNGQIKFMLEQEIYKNNKVFLGKNEEKFNTFQKSLISSGYFSNISDFDKHISNLDDSSKILFKGNGKFYFGKNNLGYSYQLKISFANKLYRPNKKRIQEFYISTSKKSNFNEQQELKKTFHGIFDFNQENDVFSSYFNKYMFILSEQLKKLKNDAKNVEKMLEKKQEKNEKRTLFLFDDTNLCLGEDIDGVNQGSRGILYNDTCKFLFSKYCFLGKNETGNSGILQYSGGNHFGRFNFLKYTKKNGISEKFDSIDFKYEKNNKIYFEKKLGNLKNQIMKDISDFKDEREVYLQGFTGKAYDFLTLISCYSNNKFFTELHDGDELDRYKQIKKSIFNDDKKKNKFYTFNSIFNKKYDKVYSDEILSETFENQINSEISNFKKYINEKTISFISNNLKDLFEITKKEQLNNYYQNFQKHILGESYKILGLTTLEDSVISGIKKFIQDNGTSKNYYLIGKSFLHCSNGYFPIINGYGYFDSDILDNFEEKNQYQFLLNSILNGKIKSFGDKNKIKFVHISNKEFIRENKDQIIIYYGDEFEFIYSNKRENINGILYLNNEMKFSKFDGQILKNSQGKLSLKYTEYYLLYEILKNVIENGDHKNLGTFRFINLQNFGGISYHDFFRGIHSIDKTSKISFSIKNNLENKIKELEERNKSYLKTTGYELISGIIKEVSNKIDELSCGNFMDNEFGLEGEQTIFSKYSGIDFFEEFSIFINIIKKIKKFYIHKFNEHD